MLERSEVVEHGMSRTGRWLRANRLRFALWIAVIEGVLIVFHQVPRLVALVLAVAIIVGYFSTAVRLRSDAARQVAWIAAVSQAVICLVPLLLIVATTAAFIAVGAIAIVALIVLLSERG